MNKLKNVKNKFKSNSGITLIALVITIIVLLILAGIAISMLTGDNSILKKAGESKTTTERKGVIESAQVDLLGQITENKGTAISKEQLINILGKYFEKAEDINEIPDNQIKDTVLRTKSEYGKYEITVKEIYNGSFGAAEVTNLKKLQNYFVGAGKTGSQLIEWDEDNNATFNHVDGENMPDETKIHMVYDSGPYIIEYEEEYYKAYFEEFITDETLPEGDNNRYDLRFTDIKESTYSLVYVNTNYNEFFLVSPQGSMVNIIADYLPKMRVEDKEIDLKPYINNGRIELPYDTFSTYTNKKATVTLTIDGKEVKWEEIIIISKMI